MAVPLAARNHQTELAPPRAPTVVVGLGNEIASDDGVGIRIADALRSALGHRPDVDVVALPWAGFSLLDVLAGRRRAVLIDCLVTGHRPPGTVVRLDPDELAGSVRLNSFHDIDFGTVLDLGASLGWRMPADIAIWAVEGANTTEFGETLSPAVAGAVARVVAAVMEELDQ